MTVPSTIASYYADATAAFVLSSALPYIIEPRTPLFQNVLQSPRASHFTLAREMGSAVSSRMQEVSVPGGEASPSFPPSFYSNGVCEEVVASMVAFQRDYGKRADEVTQRLDRYRTLLQRAGGEASHYSVVDERREPEYILCPYFAVRSDSDPWMRVMESIWAAASMMDESTSISPVISYSDVDSLSSTFAEVPENLSATLFYWVPGFDERRVSLEELEAMRDFVEETASRRKLVNLYGGYFSILLSIVGLHGFSNGLGYSESRDWPTLESTGATPARYYVRGLHAYLPTATATTLIEHDRHFRCKCEVCDSGRRLPNDLSYHELKRHFAFARAWELKQLGKHSLADLCSRMRDDAKRCRRVLRELPRALNVPTSHLMRWAAVLED